MTTILLVKVESASVESGQGASRRYCRGCLHDVSGILAARCPECGLGFDPADVRTTLDRPVPAWRRSLIMKHGVRLAVVLLVVSGWMYNVLPRPYRWDWRVWVWFGRLTGEVRWTTAGQDFTVVAWVKGPVLCFRVSLPGQEARERYWFGRQTLCEGRRLDDGRVSWRLDEVGRHRYRLVVNEAGVDGQLLSGAFTRLKGPERFFGVRVTRPRRMASGGAFAVEGDEAAVFSELVRQFGLQIVPFRLSAGQTYVWSWDAEARKMVTVDITPENAERFVVDDSEPGRVLIPKGR